METKKNAIETIEKLIKNEGITIQEFFEAWYRSVKTPTPNQNDVFTLSEKDLLYIQPNMFWYEDDTISFKKLPNKKIKAIVREVTEGIIFGDLTHSELFDVKKIETDTNVYKFYPSYVGFNNRSYGNSYVKLYSIMQLHGAIGCDGSSRIFEELNNVSYYKDFWRWCITEKGPQYGWIFISYSLCEFRGILNTLPTLAVKVI